MNKKEQWKFDNLIYDNGCRNNYSVAEIATIRGLQIDDVDCFVVFKLLLKKNWWVEKGSGSKRKTKQSNMSVLLMATWLQTLVLCMPDCVCLSLLDYALL